MANKTLFSSIKSKFVRTDTRNEAGGRAYQFTPKHALVQIAATGCFNGVYYASAESQLDEMRELIDQVDDNVFLAKLAAYGGGGTDCSIPLCEANTKYRKRRFAGCVLVSDNESWVGTGRYGSTGVLTEWQTFVANQKRLGVSSPKLVCIDIQHYRSTQAPERADILNIGGFSDAVFNVVASYLSDDAGRFVAEVESIEL